MKMRKKIAIVIAAIILIFGCIGIIYGLTMKSKLNGDSLEFDAFNLSDKDNGKLFQFNLVSDIMPIEKGTFRNLYLVMFYSGQDDDEKCLSIGFSVPASLTSSFEEVMYSEQTNGIDFKGIARKCDQDLKEKFESSISNYIQSTYEMMDKEIPNGEIEAACKTVSPYYIEVPSDKFNSLCIKLSIFLVAAAAVILLITFSKRKIRIRTILLGFLALIVVSVLAAAIVLKDKIRTMASVKEVSKGFYSMSYYENCKTDEILNANIGTISGLMEWLSDNVLSGIPMEYNVNNYGCSAFSAVSPEGNRLMGRNFDYDETDSLIVYSEPKDGYASYAMCDLSLFEIGADAEISATSLLGRTIMLAVPYVCMDGINEAGVGVGILQLDMDEVHQDNGKNDLLLYLAIRGILDKCGSVDESIKLLESYDIQTLLNCSYHLFITDKSGKSVVVEWLDNKMNIVEDKGCTNYVLTKGKSYLNKEESDGRYEKIKDKLDKTNSVLNRKNAMDLLSDVKLNEDGYSTEWSCVFDLTDFTVDVCLDQDYENVYTFKREDFK